MLRLVLNRTGAVLHRVEQERIVVHRGPRTVCGYRITGWTRLTAMDLADLPRIAAREGARICERCCPPRERRATTRADDVAAPKWA